MFTGIIETTGSVRSIDGNVLWVDVPFAAELKIGQSVSCDGVCLTVVEKNSSGFRVDVLEETKRLTRFGNLKRGDLVNVERALPVNGRFDGHIVEAHCEGLGTIKKIVQGKGDRMIIVQIPSVLMKYQVKKGIVVLNGIALTITEVNDEKEEISVAIIPHTWDQTNLRAAKEGEQVHVETDILARYVERLFHQ